MSPVTKDLMLGQLQSHLAKVNKELDMLQSTMIYHELRINVLKNNRASLIARMVNLNAKQVA